MTQIQALMTDITDFNANWFYKRRSKRAPLNIVGSLLRSFFGTLAQEDAIEYLQRFNEMDKQMLDCQVIVDEHTTFLQTTTNVLQSIHEDNLERHNNVSISNITRIFNTFWMDMAFRSKDLLTFASLSLDLYYKKQKPFSDAITFGSPSVSITPIILPPALFLDELNFVPRNISGTNLALPLPVLKEYMATYYQIASTRSRIIEDQLILSMSIPMITLTDYQLLKVTSLPRRLPSALYQFIVPEYEYIAIDQFHESYVSLTNHE